MGTQVCQILLTELMLPSYIVAPMTRPCISLFGEKHFCPYHVFMFTDSFKSILITQNVCIIITEHRYGVHLINSRTGIVGRCMAIYRSFLGQILISFYIESWNNL